MGVDSSQLAAKEADKAGGTRPDPNAFKDCKSFPRTATTPSLTVDQRGTKV